MVHWEGLPTGFGKSDAHRVNLAELIAAIALHFPYVLAFEPTFVEVRHVETGILSQVIQGNNLRLLFADAPPSTSHTANVHQSAHYPQQQGYHPYQQQPSPPAYGRPQVLPPYGPPAQAGPPPAFPGPGPGPQYPLRMVPPNCRDEILMVSDDRVLTLRLAGNGHGYHVASDAASACSK